jgi:chemotaxis protein histidine kinase CheA
MSGVSALIGRFLATASERLTQMGEVLSTLRTAPDINDVVKRIGRDLHTLKGEARLLGLPEIERVAHASEDMLFSHHRAMAITELTEQLLYEAIDTIFTCVQARGEGVTVGEGEIDAVVKRLRDHVITAASETVEAEKPATSADAKTESAKTAKTEPTKASEPKGNGKGETRDSAKPDADAKGEADDDKTRATAGGRTMHVATDLLDGMTDEVSNLSGSLVRTSSRSPTSCAT